MKDIILGEFIAGTTGNYDTDNVESINRMYEDAVEFYAANSVLGREDIRKAVYSIPLSEMVGMLGADKSAPHDNTILPYGDLMHKRAFATKRMPSQDRRPLADSDLVDGQFEIPSDPECWVAAHIPGDAGVKPAWFREDYRKLNDSRTMRVLKASYKKMVGDEFVTGIDVTKVSVCRGSFYIGRYMREKDAV